MRHWPSGKETPVATALARVDEPSPQLPPHVPRPRGTGAQLTEGIPQGALNALRLASAITAGTAIATTLARHPIGRGRQHPPQETLVPRRVVVE